MAIQHLSPARQTRYRSRAQAVLIPMPRASLDGTEAVPQLRDHLHWGPNMEGEAPSKKEGNSVEEENSESTEAAPAPVEASQGTEGPTLAQPNHPVSYQSESSFLAIMQQMTHIMDNL
ncbi:hypothetical protein O181_018146 [Austropuccinia psidii MF-1]|uniref:Uncharacterized protein n=1 Tax=Austropuccinia psidii MF-1 TaxID=1389203 RepID=A0A9Q3C917_9BASI|nr:hypothetical protein [Austropuccinia psidii MF-1]